MEDQREDRILEALTLFRHDVMEELVYIKRIIRERLQSETYTVSAECPDSNNIPLKSSRKILKPQIRDVIDDLTRIVHDNAKNSLNSSPGEDILGLRMAAKTCQDQKSKQTSCESVELRSYEQSVSREAVTAANLNSLPCTSDSLQVAANALREEIPVKSNITFKHRRKSFTPRSLARSSSFCNSASSEDQLTSRLVGEDSSSPVCMEESESASPQTSNFIKEEKLSGDTAVSNPIPTVGNFRGEALMYSARSISENSLCLPETLYKLAVPVNYRPANMRRVSAKKSAQCSICHKHFVSSTNLNVHMRTHTGERPFKCSECDKTFLTQSNLKVHTRKHTGERPYQCKECLKTFIYHSNLLEHLQSHTGAIPHVCKVCNKRFSSRSHLTRHCKSHRKEKQDIP